MVPRLNRGQPHIQVRYGGRLITPQDSMPTDDKKSTTKKTAASKEKPAAAKKVHKAGKPSNSFLVENPPPRMRGNRK